MSKYTVLIGDEKIISIAIQRARAALGSTDASLGVGFAEGIIRTQSGTFTSAWCAVATREGQYFLGGGFNIQLSDYLLRLLTDTALSESDIEKYISDFEPKSFEILTGQAAFAMKNAGFRFDLDYSSN